MSYTKDENKPEPQTSSDLESGVHHRDSRKTSLNRDQHGEDKRDEMNVKGKKDDVAQLSLAHQGIHREKSPDEPTSVLSPTKIQALAESTPSAEENIEGCEVQQEGHTLLGLNQSSAFRGEGSGISQTAHTPKTLKTLTDAPAQSYQSAVSPSVKHQGAVEPTSAISPTNLYGSAKDVTPQGAPNVPQAEAHPSPSRRVWLQLGALGVLSILCGAFLQVSYSKISQRPKRLGKGHVYQNNTWRIELLKLVREAYPPRIEISLSLTKDHLPLTSSKKFNLFLLVDNTLVAPQFLIWPPHRPGVFRSIFTPSVPAKELRLVFYGPDKKRIDFLLE